MLKSTRELLGHILTTNESQADVTKTLNLVQKKHANVFAKDPVGGFGCIGHLLVRQQKAKTLKALLTIKVDPTNEACRYTGDNMLHTACRENSVEMAGIILRHSAVDIDALNLCLETPLGVTCSLSSESQDRMVRLLIGAKANCQTLDLNGRSPLDHLVVSNQVGLVREMLKTVVFDQTRDWTPTHIYLWRAMLHALDFERYCCCRDILKTMATFPRMLEHTATGLFMTTDLMFTKFTTKQHFLGHRFDYVASPWTGPLCIAARDGNARTVQLLLRAKAGLDRHAVCSAAFECRGHRDEESGALDLLLQACPLLCSIAENYGMTLLQHSASNGYTANVHLLLERKASPHLKTSAGLSPLHLCCTADLVQTLCNSKVDPDVGQGLVDTPLHHAIVHGKPVGVVQQLLAQKADPEAKTVHGQSPVELIESERNASMLHLEELVRFGCVVTESSIHQTDEPMNEIRIGTYGLSALGQRRRCHRRLCSRQFARAWISDGNREKLCAFFKEYPGLTRFVGRVLLSYYTTQSEEERIREDLSCLSMIKSNLSFS